MWHGLLLPALVGLTLAGVPDQDPNDTNLDGCYPVAPSNGGGELRVLRTAQTPNGFHRAARGWNSWGIEANPATTPSYKGFNQEFAIAQCSVLAERPFVEAGYNLCSLDAGWSVADTDEFGRITYNHSAFDLPKLGRFLHSKGLQMGIYVIPGAPCTSINKTVMGTNLTLGDIMNENNDGVPPNPYCDFDYSNPATQIWHDSLLDLWASWGVDMIKLDFITPGSIQNGATLPANNSGAAVAFHRAIQNSGRKIRLDLSWKLCRNDTYYDIWRSTAETLRTDQDINFSGTDTLLQWWPVQREIENYRQYISLQVDKDQPLTIYPDMDNLYIGNDPQISGVSNEQRITVMSHWIGAAANLITGADMTNLDDLGRKLFTSRESIEASDFCGRHPMQPRNPGTGENLAKQLQGWIAGPDESGRAYALLTNLGPNLAGAAGYNSMLNGTQKVSLSLKDLGLKGACYRASDVWFGHQRTVVRSHGLAADLGEGESQFLRLDPCFPWLSS